jgi:hypothetical protein
VLTGRVRPRGIQSTNIEANLADLCRTVHFIRSFTEQDTNATRIYDARHPTVTGEAYDRLTVRRPDPTATALHE